MINPANFGGGNIDIGRPPSIGRPPNPGGGSSPPNPGGGSSSPNPSGNTRPPRPSTVPPPQPKPRRPSTTNINNFSSSVKNDLSVDIVATGGSSVTVNVNQTTTINNSPQISKPISSSASVEYVSPVYRGSNFVKPLGVTLNGNFNTIINKR